MVQGGRFAVGFGGTGTKLVGSSSGFLNIGGGFLSLIALAYHSIRLLYIPLVSLLKGPIDDVQLRRPQVQELTHQGLSHQQVQLQQHRVRSYTHLPIAILQVTHCVFTACFPAAFVLIHLEDFLEECEFALDVFD